MGAAGVFFRVSYGATLAYTAAGLVGPAAGMAVAHLSTAWAAVLLGYALAEYRIHTGSELAADEAAARTPPSRSEGQQLTLVHCVAMSSLTTLFLAARVVWLVFFPFYGEDSQFLLVLELSVLIWWILYFWAIIINHYLLHQAVVSNEFMKRLLCYYLASCAPSIFCGLLDFWFFAYYFGLEMMAMAAFFGYILAVNARRKDIMPRDQ
ncbi:unnamed protein product [Urochloa decumbens]|uniref:Uncharacterized protein n=1 Tax=Urochloa decumbens TaxID=240449 RepID=A0ABC9ANT2_9POAL